MRWLSLPVLLFLIESALAAQCGLEIGVVADFRGVWTDLANSHALVKKDVVCGESKVQRIANAGASSDDFLKLVSRGDPEHFITFECKQLLGCEKPLDFSALVNEEQRQLRGTGFFESFASWRRSYSTAHTLSRRSPPHGTAVLRTAVVEAGKPIPIVEIFRADAPAGSYQLDFCPQSTDEACDKSLARPMVVAWRPGSGASLTFRASSPGAGLIYRLDDDTLARTGDRVLIIAVAPSQSNRISEARDKIAVAGYSISFHNAAQLDTFEEYVRVLAERLAKR